MSSPTFIGKITTAANDETAMPHRLPTGALNLRPPFARLKCNAQQQKTLIQTLRMEIHQRMDEHHKEKKKNDLPVMIRASHSLKSAVGLFEAKKTY